MYSIFKRYWMTAILILCFTLAGLAIQTVSFWPPIYVPTIDRPIEGNLAIDLNINLGDALGQVGISADGRQLQHGRLFTNTVTLGAPRLFVSPDGLSAADLIPAQILPSRLQEIPLDLAFEEMQTYKTLQIRDETNQIVYKNIYTPTGPRYLAAIWSPDSQYLAVPSGNQEKGADLVLPNQLQVFTTQGQLFREYIVPSDRQVFQWLGWSPDGQFFALALISQAEDTSIEQASVQIISLNGEVVFEQAVGQTEIESVIGDINSLSVRESLWRFQDLFRFSFNGPVPLSMWAKNSAEFHFVTTDNNTLVWSVANPQTRTHLSRKLPASMTYLALSPSNTELLYINHESGCAEIIPLNTTTMADPIYCESERIRSASWSPNETHVAFWENNTVKVVSRATGQVQTVASFVSDGTFAGPPPKWSPNGEHLLINGDGFGGVLVHINTQQITDFYDELGLGTHYSPNPSRIIEASWSPNGRHLFLLILNTTRGFKLPFTSSAPEEYDSVLYLLDNQTNTIEKVASRFNTSTHYRPTTSGMSVWSPDNSQVIFVAQRQGVDKYSKDSLYLYDLEEKRVYFLNDAWLQQLGMEHLKRQINTNWLEINLLAWGNE
ncbi:MAG: TolB family protein [Candidatus Promineifilaceae bacterium]